MQDEDLEIRHLASRIASLYHGGVAAQSSKATELVWAYLQKTAIADDVRRLLGDLVAYTSMRYIVSEALRLTSCLAQRHSSIVRKSRLAYCLRLRGRTYTSTRTSIFLPSKICCRHMHQLAVQLMRNSHPFFSNKEAKSRKRRVAMCLWPPWP